MDQRTSLAVETLLSLGKQEWTPPSPATSSDYSETPPGVARVVEEDNVVEEEQVITEELQEKEQQPSINVKKVHT